MITAQFILFFFAFLIICMFVMGALNRDLRDKGIYRQWVVFCLLC